MDDYNTDLLAEAKNEYMSRLVTIFSPHIIEGIKSIFNEAYKLCIENDEKKKYLMTFQNFLSRVVKWNSTIINEETARIVKTSGCNYLEDLLTCVHITQLKILTSIRVSTKQKKIDIDIPKLNDFVHKVYIIFSRKLYTNIYLFEKDIMPLTYQKNMRECEILCRESILESIRDSMPIEQILKSYIDETTDEEIIEEITRVETNEQLTNDEEEKKTEENTIEKDNEEFVKKPDLIINKKETNSVSKDMSEENKTSEVSKKEESDNIKLNVTSNLLENVKEIENNKGDEVIEKRTNIDFNDNDDVINYKTTSTPLAINTEVVEKVNAPKTPERLDQISKERNIQRKIEEAEEEDDDFDDEKIKIHTDAPLKLDTLDVHDLNKDFKLEKKPLLTNIEVLK